MKYQYEIVPKDEYLPFRFSTATTGKNPMLRLTGMIILK